MLHPKKYPSISLKYFQKIAPNSFRKAFGFNFVSTILRIVCLFLLNKLFAVYLGPAGYGILAQFQNFFAISTLLGSGGIANGVTSNIAKLKNNQKPYLGFFAYSLFLVLILSLIVGLILLIFNSEILSILNLDQSYTLIFIIFVFFLPIFSFNLILLSFLSGLEDYFSVALINVLGAFFTLLLACYLATKFGIFGGIISLFISQLILFLFSIYWKKSIWKNIEIKNIYFKKKNFFLIIKTLFGFGLMTAVGSLLGNTLDIIIRNTVIENLGNSYAGIWDAINRISTYLLLPFTIMIPIYFLPKFSSIKDFFIKKLFQYTILSFFIISPILLVGAINMKSLIIISLDKNFIHILNFSNIFLLSELFRMISFLLLYFIIARNFWIDYIIIELITFLLYFVFVNLIIFDSLLELSWLRLYLNFFILLMLIGYLFLKNNNLIYSQRT